MHICAVFFLSEIFDTLCRKRHGHYLNEFSSRFCPDQGNQSGSVHNPYNDKSDFADSAYQR